MSKKRQIEMRRDGGENKNTIRMYILPRLLGFFFCFVYDMLLLSFNLLPVESNCNAIRAIVMIKTRAKNKV